MFVKRICDWDGVWGYGDRKGYLYDRSDLLCNSLGKKLLSIACEYPR